MSELHDDRLDAVYPGITLVDFHRDTPYSFIVQYLASDGRVFGIRHSCS